MQFSAFTVKTDVHIGHYIQLNYIDVDPKKSLKVNIAPKFGSNMFHFSVGTNNIIYCARELLIKKDFTGNFVLWPIPNRVRDKKYVFNGQKYSLQNIKRHRGNDVLIHGLVFDREWKYKNLIVDKDFASVETYIDITQESPNYSAYPFASRLSLKYKLSKKSIKIKYTVQNNSSLEMPFGFGLHPYFPTLSGPSGTFVMVPADYVMDADDELLPSGRLKNVTHTQFDLRQPKSIDLLNLDHVFTGLRPHEKAYIEYKKQHMNIYLNTSEEFTHMVLYTMEKDKGFFCLENQTCSTDAINLNARGYKKEAHLLTLTPGKSFTGYIEYEVKHFV